LKLRCECGHVIVDQTDGLPFKAHIRSDLNDAAYLDGLTREVERIVRRFSEAAPSQRETQLTRDLQELGMVGTHLETWGYECQQCGRLLLLMPPGADGVRSYRPEHGVGYAATFASMAAVEGDSTP